MRRAPLLRHFQTYHERGIGRKQRSAAGVAHGFEVRESLLTYQERAPQRRFMPPARLPDAQARLLDMLEVGRAHHFCILTSRDTKGALSGAEKRAGVAPCTPWAAPTARGGGASPQPTCEKAVGALEASAGQRWRRRCASVVIGACIAIRSASVREAPPSKARHHSWGGTAATATRTSSREAIKPPA